MNSGAAVSVAGLTKRYGKLTALSNLNLDVLPGEIFGFLGLNGAGKTTTIRILLDLLRSTSGRAAVLGHDCRSDGLAVRKLVGYLPGEMGIYKDMTGGALLDLMASLAGRKIDPAYRQQLADGLELSRPDLGRKLREYSSGMKRKLGIIQAFQTRPPVLILDEPTEGLDPLMQEAFYGMLAEVKATGTTVFMSSHVLSEVERVCDRIGLLRAGELVLLSTIEEVRKLAPRRVRVVFDGDSNPLPQGLSSEYDVLEERLGFWSLRVHGELGELVKHLAGLPVRDIQVDEPHLEEVLVKYYKEGE